MVVCLERGADCLHVVQLMPLPSKAATIDYFSSRLVVDYFVDESTSGRNFA